MTTTGLILGECRHAGGVLSHTLAQLRPWMLMLVIASTVDYIADMLRAMRA